MKYLMILSFVMIHNTNAMLFDFNEQCDLQNWQIVDDGVMGGLSQGNANLNEAGHLEYSGRVSLENNGGFSSLRYRFDAKNVEAFTKFSIRLKGDGKRYQFRAKTNSGDYYSYIQYFETSGEWETIEIKLADMYPTFRGRKLDMPNYPGALMEEIAFLISNRKAEDFKLELDSISLK